LTSLTKTIWLLQNISFAVHRLVMLWSLTSQQQPLIKMNQMLKIFLLLKLKVWYCAWRTI